MTDLRTLHEAFTELEARADRYVATEPHVAGGRRWTRTLLAPAAAAAAVVAAAGTLAALQSSSGHSSAPEHPVAPAGGTTTVASHSAASAKYEPPSDPAVLAAKARAILAGIATITVTDTGHPLLMSLPPAMETSTGRTGGEVPAQPAATSGSAIIGMLTASGVTGGYDLNVDAATPGSTAFCDEATHCSVRTLPDGTSLAVQVWHDPTVAGGVTYEVNAVRPNGPDVLLHLSTERDSKGQSVVTAAHLPLTEQQMIAFVTSDRW